MYILCVITVILFAHCVCMHDILQYFDRVYVSLYTQRISGELHSIFILRWL